MESRGDWILTYTGRKFYPFDPKPEDINLEDIAHALSLQCRFTGHCRVHYSVAQHSVLVSDLSGPHRRWGLLHDASEAYLTDVASPVKRDSRFATYRDAEDLIMQAVCVRFGLDMTMPDPVHEADRIALESEAKVLMPHNPDWQMQIDPRKLVSVIPVSCTIAEKLFLQACKRLEIQ